MIFLSGSFSFNPSKSVTDNRLLNFSRFDMKIEKLLFDPGRIQISGVAETHLFLGLSCRLAPS